MYSMDLRSTEWWGMMKIFPPLSQKFRDNETSGSLKVFLLPLSQKLRDKQKLDNGGLIYQVVVYWYATYGLFQVAYTKLTAFPLLK